jgi:hypothetical protein
MSTLSLRLPRSLHQKVRELADADEVSINQFIATAVAEKTAALLTVEYLEKRGRRASRAAFDRVLARVPDVPPVRGDERKSPRQPNKAVQPTSRARKSAKSPKRTRAARG